MRKLINKNVITYFKNNSKIHYKWNYQTIILKQKEYLLKKFMFKDFTMKSISNLKKVLSCTQRVFFKEL